MKPTNIFNSRDSVLNLRDHDKNKNQIPYLHPTLLFDITSYRTNFLRKAEPRNHVLLIKALWNKN